MRLTQRCRLYSYSTLFVFSIAMWAIVALPWANMGRPMAYRDRAVSLPGPGAVAIRQGNTPRQSMPGNLPRQTLARQATRAAVAVLPFVLSSSTPMHRSRFDHHMSMTLARTIMGAR